MNLRRVENSEILTVDDKESVNLVYTHYESNPMHICFASDVIIFATVRIDVKLDLPSDLIETSDFHKLENLIYNTTKLYKDFNSRGEEVDKLEKKAVIESNTMNNKIVKLSFLEIFFMVFMGLLQLGILRWNIKKTANNTY